MPKLLTVIGLSLVAAAGLSAQSKNPSLAGTWKFDPEKTREAEAKPLSEAGTKGSETGMHTKSRTASGGAARGGTQGGGDNPAAGGAGGRGESGGGGRGNLGPLGLYARPLPMLTIEQTDTSVTISDPRGTPRTYRTDGHKSLEPLLGADSLEIVARWKDGKLTTERRLGSFGTIRETYRLDAEAHQLIVDVKLTGSQGDAPLEMHRIYTAAPAGGS